MRSKLRKPWARKRSGPSVTSFSWTEWPKSKQTVKSIQAERDAAHDASAPLGETPPGGTKLKDTIIAAYSCGALSQEEAIALIRRGGLVGTRA